MIDYTKCHGYTNRLAWSSTLKEQVYLFTCETCKGESERVSRRGYEPPRGCTHCGASWYDPRTDAEAAESASF